MTNFKSIQMIMFIKKKIYIYIYISYLLLNLVKQERSYNFNKFKVVCINDMYFIGGIDGH